jgi:hypothetical protein
MVGGVLASLILSLTGCEKKQGQHIVMPLQD